MSDHKKTYEKPLKLDMDMGEALEKFSAVTKEEANQLTKQEEMLQEGESNLAIFRGKEIRQIFHESEWFFSIVDVIQAIVGTDKPSRYWADLKKKTLKNECDTELFDNIEKLPMPSADGKLRKTESVNTETLFRIVQSIPSKKAEPFKKWLAKVGYERIQEIQDPEIAIKRAMLTYKAQGRTDEWINQRVQTIVSRKILTHEWKTRGIQDKQYGILTNVISRQTFNVTTSEHKKVKGLKSQNLRDHMSPLELALTMLGETTTAEIAKNTDAQGYAENESAAHTGGKVAGDARKNIERTLNKSVVTPDNYLPSSKQKNLPNS